MLVDRHGGTPSRVDPPPGRPADPHRVVPAQYPRRLARRTQRPIRSPIAPRHDGNRVPVPALHTARAPDHAHPPGYQRNPAVFSRIAGVPAVEKYSRFMLGWVQLPIRDTAHEFTRGNV